MAALDRQQDSRPQQTSRTDSNGVRRSSNPEVNWQTPVVSAKFQARFPRGPGTAGGVGAAMGSSRPDHTDEFCSSSSSFQPIRCHITIPTAHVMPSTQGSSPGNPHQRGGYSPSSAGTSTGPTPGVFQAGEPAPAASSKALSMEDLPPPKTEYGFENSMFPGSEHGREDRKFDIPNMEPTLNQSALLDTFSSDPRLRFQMYNHAAVPPEMGREPYRSLPECMSAPSSGTDGPSHPSRSISMPLGFQHSNVYSKPLAPPPQMWRQEPYPLQPDMSGERGTWRQQQHHQLESMRARMEQLQLMNSAACHQPSVYGAATLPSEPSHWESLLKSSESLLKDKDLLVDRQRQHITQLEQKMRESELQVHSALLGRSAPYGDVYVLRLQEVQRENTFLRAQFTEQYEAFRKEKAELEQKLAVMEVNSKSFCDTLKEATQKHVEELKKQEERVKGRDKHINTLKKKCQKESEQNREKRQRIETLERYLAGLPTQEDHQKQSQQLKEMSLKSADLQEKLTELERSLGEARAACRAKDAQMETEKQRGLELLATAHSLQEKADECLKNSGGDQSAQEMEDLKRENQSLKKEQEYLKKIVDSQKRKIDQLSSQVKSLQEQAAQEEGADQDLNEESRRRDTAVQQLGRAVKELSLQNQDLIEKNLLLQERLRQLDPGSVPPGDPTAVLMQLYRDLAWCLQDLQSVCSTLTQRAQGRDPNLSLLLGIHSVPPDMDESENLQNAEALARKVAEVKQLHKDIDDLRTTISDRYAQDMGDNCVTQ